MRRHATRLAGIALCVVGFAAAATPATAQRFEDGAAAYKRKDFLTSINVLVPFAEKGDARAQYLLGRHYQFGQGVKTDRAEAYYWYRRAELGGHVEAQLFRVLLEKHWKISVDDKGRAERRIASLKHRTDPPAAVAAAKVEKTDKTERTERAEKAAKAEKVEKTERADRNPKSKPVAVAPAAITKAPDKPPAVAKVPEKPAAMAKATEAPIEQAPMAARMPARTEAPAALPPERSRAEEDRANPYRRPEPPRTQTAYRPPSSAAEQRFEDDDSEPPYAPPARTAAPPVDNHAPPPESAYPPPGYTPPSQPPYYGYAAPSPDWAPRPRYYAPRHYYAPQPWAYRPNPGYYPGWRGVYAGPGYRAWRRW